LSAELRNAFRRRRRRRSTSDFELTTSLMHSHEMHSRTRRVLVLSPPRAGNAKNAKYKNNNNRSGQIHNNINNGKTDILCACACTPSVRKRGLHIIVTMSLGIKLWLTRIYAVLA